MDMHGQKHSEGSGHHGEGSGHHEEGSGHHPKEHETTTSPWTYPPSNFTAAPMIKSVGKI